MLCPDEVLTALGKRTVAVAGQHGHRISVFHDQVGLAVTVDIGSGNAC